MTAPPSNEQVGFVRRVLRGATFLGVAQYGLLAIGVVKTFVLSRLIIPEIHGALGLAIATVSFINFFRMDLREAVLSDPSGNPARLTVQYTVETVTALFGVILGIIIYLSFPALASPQDWALIFVLLAVSLFSALTSTPLHLLHRDLRYKAIASLTISGAITGFALAVIFTLRGQPLLGLVLDFIMPAIMLGIGSWLILRWRPRFVWDRHIARDVLSFSFTLWTSGLLGKITFQFDDWLVGVMDGKESLAVYGKAYNLAKMPMDVFAGVIGGIALAMYAQGAALGQAVLKRTYTLTTWLLMRIVSWSSIVILAAAEEIVPIMLGPGWDPAVGLVRWMFVFVLGRPLFQNNGQLLVATRNEKLFRRSSLIQAVVLLVVGPPLVFQWGAVGASIAVSVMMIFGVIASQVYVTRHNFNVSWFRLYAVPVLQTLLFSPFVFAVGNLFSDSIIITLIIKGIIATGLFAGFTYLLERQMLTDVIALVQDNLFKPQGDASDSANAE